MKRNSIKYWFSLLIVLVFLPVVSMAQQAEIRINAAQSEGMVSPLIYGQFIEYMGRCIDGGIFEENSPLSDARGFRLDVLEKAKELQPTILRFPGGTVVKTFHWEDGVGPKENRKAKKNLIWGGVNTFHFGTCEFIEYCRELQCEPCLVINLSTGSPDEAANWVEYCNGTQNTYYANLRRSHGYPKPFNVKYWALGNEEGADADAGKHQDPKKYVEDVWHFVKLMKLTDPSIKLIANGEGGNMHWNKTVLDGLGGAIDYISYHFYVGGDEGKPYSIFRKIKGADNGLSNLGKYIRENYPDTVKHWQDWYRFPPRQNPIKIAFDEWGIWEWQEPPYGTTNTYEWRHALATAQFLNLIIRNAKYVGMANWAQMVNILAPIMTNESASVRQTVFYPLKEYREKTLGECVSATVRSPLLDENLESLDISATIDREKQLLTLTVVNFSPKDIETKIVCENCKVKAIENLTRLTGTAFDAKNTLKEPLKNIVNTERISNIKNKDTLLIKGSSVSIVQFKLEK